MHVESPDASRQVQQSGREQENLSLFMGAGGLVVGSLVSFVLLRDLTPFSGGWQAVGSIASATAGIVAAIVFLVVMLRNAKKVVPWFEDAHLIRRVVQVGGLVLLMGSLTFFTVRAVNSVVSAAFIGLRLDKWSGLVFVAVVTGIGAYFVAGAAGRLTTETLAVMVSAFLVIGALLSAVNASDQLWWQVHFSRLGMLPGPAGFAFNYTLVLTGLVILTIADFLAHDMRHWLEATGQGRWKSIFVRIGLMAMGAALAGVGFVPVNVSHGGHLLMTYAAVGAFVVLAFFAPMILRGIPWGFRLVSWVLLGFVALLGYLFRSLGYLGTTGFEMLAVSTVLVWMMLLVRTITVTSRDAREAAAQHEAP